MKNKMERLEENAAIILPENGLREKMHQAGKENRKLIIKLGFDPTAPDLHLGHAVVLKKLKQFQELGHELVIIVGSFTAQIGDPTGKNKSRKPLSRETVMDNADTYIGQLSKIIDVTKCRILFNGDWLQPLPFDKLLRLLGKVTVAQLLQRNDFNKRFTENQPIAMHELMYPILQGFDSLHIKADVEMGGTDQLFNCTMGRQLQEAHDVAPQVVMCMPLLRGTDGKEKMSKSLNNYIGLTESPQEMFGKVMSIPDDLIPEYLQLTTDFSAEELALLHARLENGENPMNFKKIIAKNIIQQYHNDASADAAGQFFVNQFQNRAFDEKAFEKVPIESLGLAAGDVSLLELCHGLKREETRGVVRRLIMQGGVSVDDVRMMDANATVVMKAGMRVRMGKRLFVELF